MRYFVLLAVLLAGCATQDKQIAKAAEQCERIGFKPDTDAFRNCQLKVINDRKMRAVIRSRD